MKRRGLTVIEANIVNLSKQTKNLNQVLQILEACDILDFYDLWIIKRSGRTNSQRCVKLYETILQKNSDETFETLMKTFVKTDNNGLLGILGITPDQVTAAVSRSCEDTATKTRDLKESKQSVVWWSW